MKKSLILLMTLVLGLPVICDCQKGCCCSGDVTQELVFPGLDFEFPPDPPFMWFNNYPPGSAFGPWTVVSGSIDHLDRDYPPCLSCGNPNGKSFFVDLFGSPSGPGYGEGTIRYTLTGLTPGNLYNIEWYYATFVQPGNYTANMHVANWLNVNWKATNTGNVVWLKASYPFTAQNSTADLEFTDTGNTIYKNSQNGMLIDDIKIFEVCQSIDLESPMVINPPNDTTVECIAQVPPVPKINVVDNCDLKPKISFYEDQQFVDSCTTIITRTWELRDRCDNLSVFTQVVNVIDMTAPEFEIYPKDKLVRCDMNVPKEFSDWIKRNGYAKASDPCLFVRWETSFDRSPFNFCDTVPVVFTAIDHCGNANPKIAKFIVVDTTAPTFKIPPHSVSYFCVPNIRDSLREWLANFGFSVPNLDCSLVTLSSNFKGDSTKNPLDVIFYIEDQCGNIDSNKVSFYHRENNDTTFINQMSCNYNQSSSDTLIYSLNGCDSIVIINKTKIKPDTTNLQFLTCDKNQITYDTSYFINQFNCDSLVITQFIYQPPSITNLKKFDCTFSIYSIDTVFYQGSICDSFVITEYFPLKKDTISIVQSTCDLKGVKDTIFYLKNLLGCDSIVILSTIYTSQKYTNVTKQECGLLFNYIDTFKYSNGLCDSFVITSHIALKIDTNRITTYTCNKNDTGKTIKNLTNTLGCDSIIIESVILNHIDSITIYQPTCDSIKSGIKIQILTNKFNCDSVVSIITEYHPINITLLKENTCIQSNAKIDTIIYQGSYCDSIVIKNTKFLGSDTTFNKFYTCYPLEAKVDTLYYLNSNQCDSIVINKTILLNSDTKIIDSSSCIPNLKGIDTIFLTNSNGCDSLIIINYHLVPINLKFSLDSITCYNKNDGIFKILNYYEWSQPLELFINNKKILNANEISNLSSGDYIVYIKDKNGCLSDSVKFNLTNPENLIIDIGSNLEVEKGSIVFLNLNSNKTLQKIIWLPNDLINCDNCYKVEFIPNKNVWIYSEAIDINGCIQLDSIFILIKKSNKIFVPNTFSPNGDNINDNFYIQGDPDAIIQTFFIYDRWGEQVFYSTNTYVGNPSSGWNGTFKSLKMNPGVYVYYAKVLTSDGDIIELKGDVTLIR